MGLNTSLFHPQPNSAGPEVPEAAVNLQIGRQKRGPKVSETDPNTPGQNYAVSTVIYAVSTLIYAGSFFTKTFCATSNAGRDLRKLSVARQTMSNHDRVYKLVANTYEYDLWLKGTPTTPQAISGIETACNRQLLLLNKRHQPQIQARQQRPSAAG